MFSWTPIADPRQRPDLIHPDFLGGSRLQIRAGDEPPRQQLRLRHMETDVGEIPALDHLAAALSDVDFSVVAVSVDRKGIEAVRKVFTEGDVKKLPIYIDRSSEALRAVRAVGLPTSLFIDREGREFGRVVGPAQWDDPATIAFFRHVVARFFARLSQPNAIGARWIE